MGFHKNSCTYNINNQSGSVRKTGIMNCKKLLKHFSSIKFQNLHPSPTKMMVNKSTFMSDLFNILDKTVPAVGLKKDPSAAWFIFDIMDS